MVPTRSLPAPLGDRFEVRRRLGAGGVGVVYEAFDRVRSELVAVKTLREPDPAALGRFKREFRALADVIHPNLIQVHRVGRDVRRWRRRGASAVVAIAGTLAAGEAAVGDAEIVDVQTAHEPIDRSVDAGVGRAVHRNNASCARAE
ncbi:MAG: Serine/threonine-protein kinase PknA [bacterium]|nr:Serine/threonine-protein kinase PknA [bacterium]